MPPNIPSIDQFNPAERVKRLKALGAAAGIGAPSSPGVPGRGFANTEVSTGPTAQAPAAQSGVGPGPAIGTSGGQNSVPGKGSVPGLQFDMGGLVQQYVAMLRAGAGDPGVIKQAQKMLNDGLKKQVSDFQDRLRIYLQGFTDRDGDGIPDAQQNVTGRDVRIG